MARIIFENANLFDGIESPKPGSYVLVEGNRIGAVGQGTTESTDADRRIDLSGKTIMPGLIDVHAHLGYAVLDVNPQKDWQYYANLAYGVTENCWARSARRTLVR